MSGLMSYSGLTTKIRAMEGTFITDDQFREIAELSSVPQVVLYLKKNRGYAEVLSDLDENNMHRGQIESLLRYASLLDYSSLYHFSNQEQRKFLKLYSRRFEIRILKSCLSNIFDHREITPDLSALTKYCSKYTDLNVQQLGTSTTIEEFINNLKGTVYYDGLKLMVKSDNPTLYDYEIALDLYYFSYIWKHKDKILKGKDLDLITKAYGSKFDMLNLWWIHRAKRYYKMSTTDIYAMLIPVRYKLHKDEISSLVEAESTEEFNSILSKTYYGRVYDNVTPDTLEDMYVYVLKHILLKESQQNPYSVATVYSYLYQKEHEINRLIIALECIRYGLPAEETMSYIVKT